ncbi:hypothetical protein OROMI_010897 [Orobanche minor]
MSDIEPESKSSACQVAFGQTSKSMEKGTNKFMGARDYLAVAFEVYGETAILEAIRSLSNQAQFNAKEAESNAAKSMLSIEEEPAESMPGKVPIEEEPTKSILGKRKAKEAFESNTAKSMAAKVPREEELAKSMPGKLPPIEEEPGLGKVPIEGGAS